MDCRTLALTVVPPLLAIAYEYLDPLGGTYLERSHLTFER
jgi:hypothetical protein